MNECLKEVEKINISDYFTDSIKEFLNAHTKEDLEKLMKIIEVTSIENAIKYCDNQPNCVECVKCHTQCMFGDIRFVPCNNIRLMYGVSIWDYKKGRRKL